MGGMTRAGTVNRGRGFRSVFSVLTSVLLLFRASRRVAPLAAACILLSLASIRLGAQEQASQDLDDAARRPPPEKVIAINPNVTWRSSHWAGPLNATLAAMRAQGPFPKFWVAEPDRWHVWVKYFDLPIEVQRYPMLVIRYRVTATGPLKQGYVLWLDDGTGPDSGGLTPSAPDDLVLDGQVHEVTRDLRKNNPKGDLIGMALGVICGPAAPTEFELLGLRFEAAADAANPAPLEDAPVTVAVVDPAGQPVPGANVIVDFERCNWARSAVTDASGKATIRPLANYKAKHMVRVSKPGMTAVEVADLGKAQQPPTVTLSPAHASSISGRVTYEDGSAASGAAVLLSYSGPGLYYDDFAIADAQGRYEFLAVGASEFRCSAAVSSDVQPGVPASATLKPRDLRPGSTLLGASVGLATMNPGEKTTKDLVLAHACTVAGQVIDVTTGQPVPNFRLSGYVQVEGQRYLDSIEMTTDEQGRFKTQVAPGATFFMQWDRQQDQCLIDQQWFRSGNYQPLSNQRITGDRTDLALKVKLRPVQSLSGRVTDEQGQGIKDVAIYFLPETSAPRTDASGAFTLKLAPKDADFDLCAVSADRKRAGVAHLKAGAADAVIRLQPTRSYEGQVLTSDGMPAGSLSFYLDPVIGGERNYQLQQRAKADADGKFKLDSLIPGMTYRAAWSSDNESNRDYDYGEATIDLAALKEGEPIRFEAKQYLNALMGGVVNEKDEPIAGATIDPGQSDLLPQDARNGRSRIVADKAGQFTISRLAAGQLTLRISATGYKSGTFKTPTDSVDFKAVLKPTGTATRLQITVVDQSDKPMPNAPITLWQLKRDRGSKPLASTTSLQTDATGKAALDLPAGEEQGRVMRMILCDLPGHDLALHRAIPNEDTDARLVMRPSGSHWRGVVVSEEGKPIADAKIRVVGIRLDSSDAGYLGFPDELEDLLPQFLYRSDNDGRFEISRFGREAMNLSITSAGKAAENVYLDARRQPASAEERTITLVAGGTVTGRIVFDPPPADPSASADAVHLYFQSDGGPGGGSARVGPDWTFSSNLKAGSYRAVVYISPDNKSLRKYICPAPPKLEAATGKRIEITISMLIGLPLRGKLVTSGSTEGAMVTVSAQDDRLTQATAMVEKDGSWELYLPREGEYQIRYYLPSGERQMRDVRKITLRRDKPADELVIQADSKVQ